MIDNEKMLIHVPANGEYIEILGHRIDGFDSFEAFCEYLKKFAEMEDTINRQKVEIEEYRNTVERVLKEVQEAKALWVKDMEKARADTANEFAEKLKQCMDTYADDWCWIEMSQISFEEMVDLLVKEFRRGKKHD